MSHCIHYDCIQYAPFNAKAGEERLRDDMIEAAREFADLHIDPLEDPIRSHHGYFEKLSGYVFPSEKAAQSFLKQFEGTYKDGYVYFHWSEEEAEERRIEDPSALMALAKYEVHC